MYTHTRDENFHGLVLHDDNSQQCKKKMSHFRRRIWVEETLPNHSETIFHTKSATSVVARVCSYSRQ